MASDLHEPVLLESVMEIFTSEGTKKHTVIDATIGLGGHASEMCKYMSPDDVLFGFDRDKENLARSEKYIHSTNPKISPILIHSSFANINEELAARSIDSIDFILYDLWVSSVHYDEAERWFSLRFDAPLDMRFDRTRGSTAENLIEKLTPEALAKIFTDYGEEKKSWFIAQSIVKIRKIEKIDTTFKLLKIIEESSFDKKSPIRVFQALRIAVNEEFLHIEESLKQALSLLSPGGKIAVITFHSLEDRLVKNIFSPYLEDIINETTGQIQEKAKFKKYTKKPIIPTDNEVETNPRSRSAKMRVIERI